MSARDIVAACQRHLPVHANDCSGFVRAVAKDCSVLLIGDANSLVDQISRSARVLDDGVTAARAAAAGALVIGGVKAPGHGHVVVVVSGPLNRGRFPYAFWGQYHAITVGRETMNVGFTQGHGTINWAFGPKTRDRLVYAAYPISPLLLPRAGDTEGFLVYTFK